jgi:hypothetical protein
MRRCSFFLSMRVAGKFQHFQTTLKWFTQLIKNSIWHVSEFAIENNHLKLIKKKIPLCFENEINHRIMGIYNIGKINQLEKCMNNFHRSFVIIWKFQFLAVCGVTWNDSHKPAAAEKKWVHSSNLFENIKT